MVEREPEALAAPATGTQPPPIGSEASESSEAPPPELPRPGVPGAPASLDPAPASPVSVEPSPRGTPSTGVPLVVDASGDRISLELPVVPEPAPPDPVLPWGQSVVQIGLGAIVLAFAFFVGVWPILPFAPEIKWIVTGLVLAAIAAVSVAAFILARARSVAFFRSLRDAIAVIAIAGGAAFAALLFTPAARNEVFKLFAIVYFSLLPAFLYLQFMSVRGPTLWEEFTENLYRLRLDDAASLPKPPPHCRYYPMWLAARGPGRDREVTKTLYQKKFEGVFGLVRYGDSANQAFHPEKLAPVAMATILFSVAWVIVVMPSPLFEVSLFGHAPAGTESPHLPLETLRFGFLGAYFYAVQMLVRRYFQNDLKASAYLNATMRIVVVALLTWTVDLALQDESPSYRWSLAFVIGVFPDVGWKALQTLVKLPLRGLVRSLRQTYPLSDLDGLNVWYEARLLEEGIEDMQNLATCNLVDVMLNTRIPVERLVDWIDQSILYLHLGRPVKGDGAGGGPRDGLRRYGIRTATDLEDAFRPARDIANEPDRIAKLERLLTGGDHEPSVLRTVLATLRSEPNLPYVQAWRSAEAARRLFPTCTPAGSS
jgi:hypothetical protein